jgi:hypothetical protein
LPSAVVGELERIRDGGDFVDEIDGLLAKNYTEGVRPTSASPPGDAAAKIAQVAPIDGLTWTSEADVSPSLSGRSFSE